MQRQDANDEEHGGRGNGINIECNVGGERVSQWAATDVRGVRGQIQGTLRAPLGQVGRIQGTLRGAITKGSGTLGKGPGGAGGQDPGIFVACGWQHLGTGGVGVRSWEENLYVNSILCRQVKYFARTDRA